MQLMVSLIYNLHKLLLPLACFLSHCCLSFSSFSISYHKHRSCAYQCVCLFSLAVWLKMLVQTKSVKPSSNRLCSTCSVSVAFGTTWFAEANSSSFSVPPESIHIFGYDDSKPLHHDTVQRLTCVCSGGNPLCTPKWFKADKEVHEGTKISVNGNTVTNELGKSNKF